jgi:hypothetical protein
LIVVVIIMMVMRPPTIWPLSLVVMTVTITVARLIGDRFAARVEAASVRPADRASGSAWSA